jgi:uncharacterized membrane protein HdeD (DUF308 family)
MLGIVAVMTPLFSGIAFSVFVGCLLLVGGILETIFAFRAPSFGSGVLTFLFGGLTVVVGLLLIAMPERGLGALTFVLAGYFVAAGIVDVVLAFKIRPDDGWDWTLFSGIVTIALGAFIVWQWPVSGVWAVGIYVGIRLLMHGWALMAVGITGGDVIAGVQEERLEIVEARVRAGIEALQRVQVALAAHTVMLIALDNEVRKKVSTEEVDPAIRDLNTRLGEAREVLTEVAEEGFEAWDAAQRQAEQAFESLQESVNTAAERLAVHLGVDSE